MSTRLWPQQPIGSRHSLLECLAFAPLPKNLWRHPKQRSVLNRVQTIKTRLLSNLSTCFNLRDYLLSLSTAFDFLRRGSLLGTRAFWHGKSWISPQ